MTAYLWVSLVVHSLPVVIALLLLGKRGGPGNPRANLVVYLPMLAWTAYLLWGA